MAGNRTSRTPLPGTTATNFTYDNIYELLTAVQGATTKETYTYDPVGNRLSNLAGSGWSNNASNELTSRTGVTYTYDANGNTQTEATSSGTTTFNWDFENRLTSILLPGAGGTVTFKYDPFGRRIEKISPTTTSIFVYDADNLIETVNSSGGVVARYTQTQSVDEPLAMLGGTTTSYYEADGLGSITSLRNASGALAQTYTYDSFGNQTASSGSLTNFFRYTGREFDTETNLYYSRARYLDPSTGRFLSEDPIRYAGGSVNFYPYAGNDPIDYADPSGTTPTCDKPKCFAQLKYRHVQDLRAELAFGRTHSFLYVQGSTGIQYILSGGPVPPSGPNEKLNVGANPDIHGGVDNVSATVSWDSGLSPENCKGVDAMIAAAQGWPNNTIPYNAAGGPNSDTATHSLGTSGGFNPPAPPRTTGWNTPLPH
jgi:RHS repeat-associated protein